MGSQRSESKSSSSPSQNFEVWIKPDNLKEVPTGQPEEGGVRLLVKEVKDNN